MIYVMNRDNTLEKRMLFLSERHIEAYCWYDERASKEKIILFSKNVLQGQTCFGLERHAV